MPCPKCAFEHPPVASECPRCGIVFSRWSDARSRTFVAAVSHTPVDEIEDGRIGAAELKILGGGLAAAIVLYLIPFTRFVFSALVTLFHEIGHAVVGWLLGHPSLPAFDLIYGGGFTHLAPFRVSIALVIGAALLGLAWMMRTNRKSLAIISAAGLFWLLMVSAAWRRELAISAAGHAFELILAGIFLYKALSGSGLRAPGVERTAAAFVAFFVQIHSMLFAWRLIRDRSFLDWYRQGKGGALMNDLEAVALDLSIRFGLAPGIPGVARGLLLVSLAPFVVALVWHLQRRRWHRLLRQLRTVEDL